MGRIQESPALIITGSAGAIIVIADFQKPCTKNQTCDDDLYPSL